MISLLSPRVHLRTISLALLFLAAPSYSQTNSPEQLDFKYKELVEPFNEYPCHHQKASVGIYDWDVSCLVRGNVRKYFAHMAVSLYPKTNFGVNSYEILYWVTDKTDSKKNLNTSSTIWVHNSSPENVMRVLEVSQGIENDLSALKLVYFP